MKKVLKLQLTNLNKGDFFQFIKSIVQLAGIHPLFAVIRQVLELDLTLLEKAFAKEKVTEETKEIERLDARRDKAFMFLLHQVRSFLHNENQPDRMKAAEKVLPIIEELGAGKIAYFDYNKETAVIYNLVNALNERVSAEIATLGLSNDLGYLKQCNNEFEAYYSVRNTLSSELNGIVPFHRLIKDVAKHYTNFVADVEGIYRNNPDVTPELEQFIERLNVEIEKFKLLLPTPKNKTTGDGTGTN